MLPVMPNAASLARTTLRFPFRPRESARRILEEVNPYLYAAVLFVISGALAIPAQLLGRAHDPRLEDVPDWMNSDWAMPLLGLAGLLVTPLTAAILWAISRALRGGAGYGAVFVALVGGWVPGIFSSLLVGSIWLADVASGGAVGAAVYPVVEVLGYVVGAWSLVVVVLALAEVSAFGVGRAVGSLLLTYLLMGLAAAAVSIAVLGAGN